ncbi:ATP-binding protein [Yinghuangia seranimata]|nr:ATP-binding protein [Yinghuangia seranimata]MDI2129098.1 ATP-binding protein [Yinghuangia seranimata]
MARVRVREQAAAWGIPPTVRETAVLLVSELVTNAYLHAWTFAGAITVRCELGGCRLRLEVADGGDGLPEVRSAGEADVSGRGLNLVVLLADAWGVLVRPGVPGKTVWLECALGGQPPDHLSHLTRHLTRRRA